MWDHVKNGICILFMHQNCFPVKEENQVGLVRFALDKPVLATSDSQRFTNKESFILRYRNSSGVDIRLINLESPSPPGKMRACKYCHQV